MIASEIGAVGFTETGFFLAEFRCPTRWMGSTVTKTAAGSEKERPSDTATAISPLLEDVRGSD
jgi:hypothetical protein